VLKCGVTIQKRGIGVSSDFVLQDGKFLFSGDEAGEGAESFVQNGSSLVKIRNLFESSGYKATPAADGTIVGFECIGKDFQEGRLAGAIGPDETCFLTGIYLEGHVSKYGLGAVGLRDAA